VSSSDNKLSRSIALPNVNCDNCSVESEMTRSSQNRVMQQNIFQFCDVETLDEVFRASLCEQLNFTKSQSTQRGRRHSSVCSALRRLIELQSQTAVRVTVYDISGDNNCLFRALSLGVTGTQEQHQLIRAYVTNRMLDESVHSSLQQWFADSQSTGVTYEQHVIRCRMTANGEQI